MEIILGSASPFRQKVLKDAGFTFSVMSPDINEKQIGLGASDPIRLVMRLAHAKAQNLLKQKLPPCFLVTCDQVVVSRGRIREKPRDKVEARKRLEEYAKHPPTTVTAVVVTDTQSMTQIEDVDQVEVRFRRIPKQAVERAIARGTIMNCCGAFDLDDPDLKPYVAEIKGDRTSVIGLPIPQLKSLLKELGWRQ